MGSGLLERFGASQTICPQESYLDSPTQLAEKETPQKEGSLQRGEVEYHHDLRDSTKQPTTP